MDVDIILKTTIWATMPGCNKCTEGESLCDGCGKRLGNALLDMLDGRELESHHYDDIKIGFDLGEKDLQSMTMKNE